MGVLLASYLVNRSPVEMKPCCIGALLQWSLVESKPYRMWVQSNAWRRSTCGFAEFIVSSNRWSTESVLSLPMISLPNQKQVYVWPDHYLSIAITPAVALRLHRLCTSRMKLRRCGWRFVGGVPNELPLGKTSFGRK